MNTVHHQFARSMVAALALGAALFCTSVPGADATAAADAAARYQQERAACLNGTSNQDRATCLREAGAAQAQGKQGVADGGAAKREGNATKRCDALPVDDHKACMARMQGQGSTSGSVAGGGIVRELVTPVPAAAGSVKPEAGASGAVPAR